MRPIPVTVLYYLLSAASQLGDSIFTFYAVFHLMKEAHGGKISALIFATDALVRIFVVPLSARTVGGWALFKRIRKSLMLHIGLIVLALLPGFISPSSKTSFIVFFMIWVGLRTLNILDFQLRSELPVALDHSKILSITRSTAFSNLAHRAIQSVGPALALLISSRSWMYAAAINSGSYLLGLLSGFLGLVLLKKWASPDSYSKVDPRGETDVQEASSALEAQKRLSWWNSAFLLLVNLSFGGLALIFVQWSTHIDGFKLLSQVPPLTLLYAGMTGLLVLMIILPQTKKSSHRERLSALVYSILLLSLMILLSSVRHEGAAAVFILMSGGLYGLSLILLSESVIKKFRGPRFVQLSSIGQAFGRIGSILATLGVGFLIDLGWRTETLLRTSGILGLLATGIVVLLKRRWRIA